jgi:hypothetical protein
MDYLQFNKQKDSISSKLVHPFQSRRRGSEVGPAPGLGDFGFRVAFRAIIDPATVMIAGGKYVAGRISSADAAIFP